MSAPEIDYVWAAQHFAAGVKKRGGWAVLRLAPTRTIYVAAAGKYGPKISGVMKVRFSDHPSSGLNYDLSIDPRASTYEEGLEIIAREIGIDLRAELRTATALLAWVRQAEEHDASNLLRMSPEELAAERERIAFQWAYLTTRAPNYGTLTATGRARLFKRINREFRAVSSARQEPWPPEGADGAAPRPEAQEPSTP